MTTTVESMASTIKLIKEEAPDCRIMVGGLFVWNTQKGNRGLYGRDAMSERNIRSESFRQR